MRVNVRTTSFIIPLVVVLLSSCLLVTDGFSFQQRNHQGLKSSTSLFPQARSKQHNVFHQATTATASEDNGDVSIKEKIRADGGRFSFNCKYGALNPFAIYYGITSILLGLPWFVELMCINLFYKLTRNKVDKSKRLPIFFSHIWGVLLMFFSRSFPQIEGIEKLEKFYKEDRAAMFVANHNSWMDIPFMGYVIGWRNYKFISKAELGQIPILGRSIKTGGHVMIDRTNRRSQILTLKSGMQWLKDGIHLVTFPEGTRSKTGRLLPFKNGAFKMAHKTGAPIIPCSIVNAAKAHPHYWMFPCKPSNKLCKLIIHDPIESKDITEAELAEKVRETIISGLPEEQRPLTTTTDADE